MVQLGLMGLIQSAEDFMLQEEIYTSFRLRRQLSYYV
jgi:hypothetical protein